MAYRDIDLKVRCPYCSASPGVWCRKATSLRRPHGTIDKPHRARARKADAHDDQGRAGGTATEEQPGVVG